jgi:hypothetical protein
MTLKESLKVKETDIYGCSSCKITSETKGRMCPCPRGSCDAEIIGQKIIITEIKSYSNGNKK